MTRGFRGDVTEEVGRSILLDKLNPSMKSNIFTLNWKDIISAAISAGIVAVLGFIANLTPIEVMHIDWHTLFGVIGVTVSASLLKSFSTTSDGKFAGMFPIK